MKPMQDDNGMQDSERPLDVAGLVGVIAGCAAALCLLFGVLIPVFPWVLSGLLGLVMIGSGIFARPPLRYWILGGSIVALFPLVAFALVQALPQIQSRL